MQKAAETRTVRLEDLKELGAAGEPCITITMPIFRGGADGQKNGLRLRHLVTRAEQALKEWEVDANKARDLLEPLRGFEPDIETDDEGLVILRSPDELRVLRVPDRPEEAAFVAKHFYIRPLLRILFSEHDFYILALSQKHMRLLRCTDRSSEEIPWPESVPASLDAFMQTSAPDHVLDNKSSSGPSGGEQKGVMFGTNTDKEKKDQYLLHFFRSIDRGIHEMLRDEQKPVVLAGVEYELALYRSMNSLLPLAQNDVHGAPDGLKGGEMHKRALEALETETNRPVEKALAMFEDLGGTHRSVTNTKEVLKAAYDGRVLYLLIAENSRQMGSFHETMHHVSEHKQPVPGDEDLLNLAALQTLMHAGQVFTVSRNKIPHGAAMAAVLRY